MTTPAHDASLVREATDRLIAAVAALDEDALPGPSRLEGWTRGHVLAHLSRNADAIRNVVDGRPMYASAEAREADIADGAPRRLAAQLEDLRTSSARLDGVFAAQDAQEEGAGWARSVELRGGVTDTVSALPFRRWVEIELHHVDLDIGYGVADLPAAFTERALEYMAQRFAGHPALDVALELRDADDGRAWRTGAPGAEPQVVEGGVAALVGWLTGRTDGAGLTSPAALPALPGL